MEEREEKGGYRRRYPSLVWPILLITAGVLFLLSNMGVWEVNFWELWRLWPVLLILWGLEIFLGRRSFAGSVIVLLMTVAVVAGVVIFLITAPEVLAPSTSGDIDRIVEPVTGVEQADLRVNLAAGHLDVSRLTTSSSLIEGSLDLATSREPTWEIDRRNGQADMTLEYEGGDWFEGWDWRGGDEWDLRLSPEAGFSLHVDVGVGEATMDLTGLDIRDLTVTAGVGRTTVIFPEEGDFSAEVGGGVGGWVLEIPQEMAARVRIDRGLSRLDISRRFEKRGDVYLTEDWDTNENRVDLEVDVGVALVTIQEP